MVGLEKPVESAALRVLQDAYRLATQSLFAYLADQPGAVLAFTDEDRRLRETFEANVREDGEQATRLAELIRARHHEPDEVTYPEGFTRFNYVTYASLAPHLVEDLEKQTAALAHLVASTPATPGEVPLALAGFRDERARHLAFWKAQAHRA